MEEEKDIQTEQTQDPEKANSREDVAALIKERLEDVRKKTIEANQIIAEGKGRLKLEAPIESGDRKIEELPYDFTVLTGMEYADAMDSDANANSGQFHRITYRQALALFAKAAAKQTDGLDMDDIISRIGATDAVEGVQLASIFFSASTRAGRLRISKR